MTLRRTAMKRSARDTGPSRKVRDLVLAARWLSGLRLLQAGPSARRVHLAEPSASRRPWRRR